ncbi:MAG: hypothetical protein JSW02_10725 [candidate division WOR-3 bacterium]|nr:MAG: hypothetical protein JSW02_10725 [candidate division WOR-3 bacterium]
MEKDDKKLYDMKSTKIGNILYVEASGKRAFDTAIEITRRALDLCKEQGIHRAVADIRKLDGKVRTTYIFTIGSEVFAKIQYSSVIYKTAVIDREENAEADRFFEDVTYNRGYQLKFFDSIIDALEWLKE